MMTNLMCNRLVQPLGFGLGQTPRLSWLDSEEGDVYRVTVSTDEAFGEVVFDSGLREINRVSYPLSGLTLSPRTRYHWRVEKGETAVQSWFETGKLDEAWSAEWITPDFDASIHPRLFTEFAVDGPVKSARAYACGLGLYEMAVGGVAVSDECLSPGLCAYDKWLPYQTYDLTALIKPGSNVLSVDLGNGWYKGRYGLNHKVEFHYGEEFALICEVHVEMEDGRRLVVSTDVDTWQASRTTIVSSSIFDGEERDDTIDTQAVYPVKRADVGVERLEARRSPPIRSMIELAPRELIRTPSGDLVLDMGQNMVGWLAFQNRAAKGEQLLLQFGEVLQGDEFYRDNLRTAKCEYRYTSDGVAKTVRPRFTFYGFRYVKLTGWTKEPRLSDFTGMVLYSDMQETGSITTDNEKVNRLFENTLWGQRGNFLDVPTDCPQRDERMGWTGDAQVFFGTAAFNMDVAAFFEKYCYDLMREQAALDGDVPVVIPKHDVWQTGACAWGDAATIIPWSLYVRYGDVVMLEALYPAMKAWVDHLRRLDDGSRLWKGSFHYGDWLSLDGEDPIGNRFGGTERIYLASCYYRHSAALVAKAAGVLHYDEDARYYRQLSDEVRDAIVEEYVTRTGRLAIHTQTAYILALYMDIIPDQWREKTAYALRLKLKESGYHLRTGFIGTPYLCRVLSENGSNDIAYRLLMQEDYPSWLYEVNMGATTIWERWNSILPDGSISDTGMNSLNHYSYGSIVEWMYQNAAGIQPIEEAPGFRKFRLAPQPDAHLGSLRAVYRAPIGEIVSQWRYEEGGSVSFAFDVPAGAQAEISLPDGTSRWVRGGHHEFVASMPDVAYEDRPISEILSDEKEAAQFHAQYPSLSRMMLFSMMAGERSVNDFKREGFDTEEVRP